MTLDEDIRWRRFNDASRPCPCCGITFSGVFDIGFDHPAPWTHGNRSASGENILQVGDDRLGSDLCEIGPHRFIRSVLHLPIIGTDQSFAFGPWGSVSPDNFDRYRDTSGAGPDGQFDGCFAWLMNNLPGFQFDDWLPCNLIVDDPDQRPLLEVHDGAHELADLQENGITFDQLLDIYAAAGQDIRPHLDAN